MQGNLWPVVKLESGDRRAQLVAWEDFDLVNNGVRHYDCGIWQADVEMC